MSFLVEESEKAKELRSALEAGGDYKILRRIDVATTTREACEASREAGAAPLLQALIIDCEATGTDAKADHLLSVSALPVWYDRASMSVKGIGECLTWYNDPGEPISEQITELTGITDDMVKGQSLDISAITRMIEDSVVCIAHHAEYDRTLASRYIPACATGHWACSVNEVPWKERGYRRSSLGDLLADNGFFYTAHRSDNDCIALATLLGTGSHPPLFELLENARKKSCTLYVGCDYMKPRIPMIRERGFFWDGTRKQWHKTFPADDIMSEIAGFLQAAGPSVTANHVKAATIVLKTSKDRYLAGEGNFGVTLPKETVASMFTDSGYTAAPAPARGRSYSPSVETPPSHTNPLPASRRTGRMSMGGGAPAASRSYVPPAPLANNGQTTGQGALSLTPAQPPAAPKSLLRPEP